MTIESRHNPEYAKGSALSLYAARDVLRSPTLIMDADVVFPSEFLVRLLGSVEPNAFLIDEDFHDTGEEVKIYVQAGRVIALGKKVVPEAWDAIGEGIGFFKCGPDADGGSWRSSSRSSPRAAARASTRTRCICWLGESASACSASAGCPGPRSTSPRTCTTPHRHLSAHRAARRPRQRVTPTARHWPGARAQPGVRARRRPPRNTVRRPK